MNVFSKVQAEIDNALVSYVFDTTTLIINWIAPVFQNLLIIYVALWGYAFWLGTIDEPFTDGLKRILRITVVLTLALTVKNYNDLVVSFIYGGPEQLAGVISGAKPTAGLLDGLLEKGIDIGDRAWAQGGVLNGDFGKYFLAIIIYLSVIALTAYAAFLIFMSKIALAILLAIGPVFIVMVLFKTTQRFFESWLSMVINYGLLLVLAVSAVQITLGLVGKGVGAVHSSGVTEVISMSTILILVILSMLLLRQVPSIASGLAGGVELSTQRVVGESMSKVGRVSGKLWRGSMNHRRQAYQRAKSVLGRVHLRRYRGNSVSSR